MKERINRVVSSIKDAVLRKIHRLLLREQTIRRVLSHDRFVEGILSSDVFFSRALPRIIRDQRYVNAFITRPDLRRRLRDLPGPLRKLVLHPGVYEQVLIITQFTEGFRKLDKVVAHQGYEISLPRTGVLEKFCGMDTAVINEILDVFCKEDVAALTNGRMRFVNRISFWVLINEILLNEEYYFQTDTDSPRILDCGTNFGLAVYYFKQLYPKARITCFEPMPEMFNLAVENFRANNLSDVEVLPYALDDEDKRARFVVSSTDPMAGSLTDRRRSMGESVTEIEVECRKLSSYLTEPVHYLKLDIEGSEDKVLKEAEPFLKNVQHIFCEYHHGLGLAPDRLAVILQLLDRAGFEVQVGKSWTSGINFSHRPMDHVEKPYSAVIHAKNKHWPHGQAPRP